MDWNRTPPVAHGPWTHKSIGISSLLALEWCHSLIELPVAWWNSVNRHLAGDRVRVTQQRRQIRASQRMKWIAFVVYRLKLDPTWCYTCMHLNIYTQSFQSAKMFTEDKIMLITQWCGPTKKIQMYLVVFSSFSNFILNVPKNSDVYNNQVKICHSND